MPMQVNGQEGDLGKPLSGQKRDLGKRSALKKGEKGKRVALEKKMRGAGKMVAGLMATRSVTRTLSIKASQDPLSSSESDQFLHEMFLEWAEKNEKNYKTDDEKNERFKIWCASKKYIDDWHSHEPGYVFSSDDLNILADMTPLERGKMRGAKWPDPYESQGRPPRPEFWGTEKGKEVAEAEAAFDKWIAEHKRNYGSVYERKERFRAFFCNKTRIDALKKAKPGYSTYGYDLDIMDLSCCESYLISLLNTPGKGCSE